MTIADLSLVTRTLLDMLDQRFQASGLSTVTARSVPPDVLTEDTSGKDSVGLYLYHVTEEPYFKSQAPTVAGNPPIQFTPMALNLHYQLTAHATATDLDQRSYDEQGYMSVAMKAMHDFAMMNESTIVVAGNAPVFDKHLTSTETHLRIALLPIAHLESLQFWNTASKHPRLSAYYQVSVVMLNPERARGRASRVLKYGIQTFVGHGPHLEGSVSTVRWQDPDGTTGSAEARPAIVTAGDPGSRGTFYGSGFLGNGVILQIRNKHFAEQTNNDRDIVEDPTWPITNDETSILAGIGETASGLWVVPGMHSARIRVRIVKPTPSGPRPFDLVSNETPFLVAPNLRSISASGGVYSIDGWLFAPPAGSPPLLRFNTNVLVGGTQLTPTLAAPAAGEFFIADERTIRFVPPAGLASPFSVRVIVDGAESAPWWTA